METDRSQPEPISLRIMLRLFLVPLAVVLVCVGVFLLFGLIAGDRKTGQDYVNEIRSGTEIRRWQAAFELATYVRSKSPERLREENLVQQFIHLFEEAETTDPRIRRYLALTLGRLQDPRAVGTLVKALEETDDQTVIYAAWALGNIGAIEASPHLARLLGNVDSGIRKMAAYSLGALDHPDNVPALRKVLSDPEVDVTWNAALALGRLHDPTARTLLEQMTRRSYLVQFPEVSPAGRDQIVINAVRSLAHLGDPSTRPRLESISREDPSTKVRAAALAALDQMPESQTDTEMVLPSP
ncbi:MAG: HEAT repeat domain-containing protein [Acidobacteria bacterium]|nr:HEAT repeat domain-containing protein [Acidobacteriota bacterium]